MQHTNLLLFPIHYHASVVPFSVSLVSVITLLLISMVVDLFYRSEGQSRSYTFSMIIFDIIKKPFLVLFLCFAIYACCDSVQLYLPHTFSLNERYNISYYLSLVEGSVFCWIIFRAIKITKRYLTRARA